MHSNLSRYCVCVCGEQGHRASSVVAQLCPTLCQRRRLWNGQGDPLSPHWPHREGGTLWSRLMDNNFWVSVMLQTLYSALSLITSGQFKVPKLWEFKEFLKLSRARAIETVPLNRYDFNRMNRWKQSRDSGYTSQSPNQRCASGTWRSPCAQQILLPEMSGSRSTFLSPPSPWSRLQIHFHKTNTGLPCFLKSCSAPLCFHKRSASVPVFANWKKSEEEFYFYEKRIREKQYCLQFVLKWIVEVNRLPLWLKW